MLADQAWQKIFEMPQIAIAGGLAIGCLIAIAGIIASHWYKAQKLHSDNVLKQTLVERGLSVDEIARIIAAGREEESED